MVQSSIQHYVLLLYHIYRLIIHSNYFITASPPQSPSFYEPSFNTRITPISATIRWTGSSRATKYQVICSTMNGSGSIWLVSSILTAHYLKPCTLYFCCVGGIDSNGAIGAMNCTSFRPPFSPIGGKHYFRYGK
jgi:hypothetical protein